MSIEQKLHAVAIAAAEKVWDQTTESGWEGISRLSAACEAYHSAYEAAKSSHHPDNLRAALIKHREQCADAFNLFSDDMHLGFRIGFQAGWNKKPIAPVSVAIGAASIAKLDNSVFMRGDYKAMAEYCAKAWELPYVD